MLIVFIFSILGNQIFAKIKWQEHLNQEANFVHFGRSFLTLMRASTGEGWDFVLKDMMMKYSISNQCDESMSYQEFIDNGKKTNECGYSAAWIYFYLYTLIVGLVFLNLFVAIILEGFNDINAKDKQILNDDSVERFRQVWSTLDPKGTGFIEVPKLKILLTLLGKPLGFSES